MPKTVLVTGAAGFIGSHLVARLLSEGANVHIIVRPQTSLARLQPILHQLTVHRLSLGDAIAVSRCLAQVQPDQIFHLATSTSLRRRAELADGFVVAEQLRELAGLLTAAATHARPRVMVRTASLAVYGRTPPPHRETQREMPLTAYAVELVAGAHLAGALQSTLPFPVISVRLSLVYGPGQSDDYLVPSLIRSCVAGAPAFVRHPAARRDILFVADAVDGLCRIADAPNQDAPVVNLASGIAPTMRQLAETIISAAGADPALVRFGPPDAAGDIPDLRPSPDLASTAYGWRARTSLAAAIDRTVDWYRRQRPADAMYQQTAG